MRAKSDLLFPPFRLDPANAQLWRGEEEISLRRKSFEMLCYLADRPGKLVTKDALLDALWPDVTVGDSLPASSVKELRKALGDDARAPRFIETVHRRGYRFIAPVNSTIARTASTLDRDPTWPRPLTVGREKELARLRRSLADVIDGKRLTLFVTGEAGIGKTTLVQSFLDSISQEYPVRIGRGQCIEHYGSGEPYMPILEALSRLARDPDGKRVREVLYRFAPTWLAQMPELLASDERVHLQSETQGVTQQRMLREIAQSLEALAEETALILLLEDLHWSDLSTLELISAFARRSVPTRILLLGTYRPAEASIQDRPLLRLKEELEVNRLCEELRLRLLSQEHVMEYLARRSVSNSSKRLETLGFEVHVRTEGNPLFMVNLVDYFVGAEHAQDDEAAETIYAPRLDTPHSVTQMIERNLERLGPDEQTVLEAASVAGVEFSAAMIAAALERSQAETEVCLIRLSRREQFVREQPSPISWPDGTVATGFRFHHSLYEEVLYDRLSIGQRAHFHRLIANRLEAAYGGRCAEIASELANHYRHANLKPEAIQYFQLAGQRAISRSAVTEARAHFADAIKLLHGLPEGISRDRRELDLHLAVAPVLVAVIGGWYASETERAWDRAQELCDRLGDSRQLFPTIFGMYALHLVRGRIDTASGLAKQLLSRAKSTGDSAEMLYARIALGVTSYFMGEFSSALDNLEASISIYDFERHGPLMLHYGFDAGVWALCYAAAAYWQLGYSDQAVSKSEAAFALARKQSHPLSLAQAELWTGILRQMRGEPHLVGEISDRLSARSVDNGLTDWLYWAACLRGWAIAKHDHQEKGIAEIRENQEALEARGLEVWRPYFLCLLADACLATKRADDGLSAMEEAIKVAEATQERAHESEIYRLKGELLLQQLNPDTTQACFCFERAIAVAHRQSAKTFELKATTSFALLLAKQGLHSKARTMLEEIYNWFTEGFDAKALKEAKALLDQLG